MAVIVMYYPDVSMWMFADSNTPRVTYMASVIIYCIIIVHVKWSVYRESYCPMKELLLQFTNDKL